MRSDGWSHANAVGQAAFLISGADFRPIAQGSLKLAGLEGTKVADKGLVSVISPIATTNI